MPKKTRQNARTIGSPLGTAAAADRVGVGLLVDNGKTWWLCSSRENPFAVYALWWNRDREHVDLVANFRGSPSREFRTGLGREEIGSGVGGPPRAGTYSQSDSSDVPIQIKNTFVNMDTDGAAPTRTLKKHRADRDEPMARRPP